MSEHTACHCDASRIEPPATIRTIKLKLDLRDLAEQLRTLADALDPNPAVREQVSNTHDLRDDLDEVREVTR